MTLDGWVLIAIWIGAFYLGFGIFLVLRWTGVIASTEHDE